MKHIAFNFNNSLNIGVVSDDAPMDMISRMTFGTEYTVLTKEDLTKFDSCFFGAYEFDKKTAFKVNIDKAKDIWLDHYRRARTPLLEKLDLEYMRADEVGNIELKKELAAKKQALRDVTKTELPNTLEGIKKTWPEILGKNPLT